MALSKATELRSRRSALWSGKVLRRGRRASVLEKCDDRNCCHYGRCDRQPTHKGDDGVTMTIRAVLALAGLLLSAFGAVAAQASTVQAAPAILFEVKSGKVLYAEDPDDQWHPASLTKIMTAYLTFEALKAKRIALASQITYSKNAAQQPPSRIGLRVGAKISIDMALKAIIVKSANDIAVSLAEALGGSEHAFVALMNAKAKQLGMRHTHFVNPNGLPAPQQVTTARDMAMLARAAVRDFPQYAFFWGLQEFKIGRALIRSHNDVLRSYPGANGMKTGYICDSRFNLVAAATRNDVQMIAVLLGEENPKERRLRAEALLDHGFNSLGWKLFFTPSTIYNLARSPSAMSVAQLRASKMVADCKVRRRAAKVAAARRRARRQARARKRDASAQRKAAVQRLRGSQAAQSGSKSVSK